MTDVEQRASEPDPAVAAAPALTAPARRVPPVLALVRRVPFTTGYVAVTMVLAIATGTLWSSAEDKPWFDVIGYGLPAFADGRWYTLITGNFFALYPVYYLFVVGLFALLTGFAEWQLGTARTVVLCFVYQIAAILVTALVFWVFSDTDWYWATVRGSETDVGFSAGMMAVLAVASATVRPPWRLRLRLIIWLYVVFSILFIGQMADAEHFVAVVLTLPVSARLAGPRALKARALPTRGEVRLLAAVGALLISGSQLVNEFLPDRVTPFGETDDDPDTWYITLGILLLTLLVLNGLRRGYRIAWWAALVLTVLPLVLAVAVGVIVIIALSISSDGDFSFYDLPAFAADVLLSLAYFCFLIATRSAFQVPRRGKRRSALAGSNPEIAKDLLKSNGGSTISWMTTWPENRHMISADGTGYLAFRRHAGVAVALGDPVGPGDAVNRTIDEFVAMCDKTALVPYLFSCTATTTAVTDGLGWRSVQVAEDNLIDLPGLEFKGKKWQDIRTALNKGPKEGIRFEMVTLADQSWAMVNQVEHLSEEWLGDKELPEMGFTLGGVTEALDPDVRVGLAIDAEGTVHGVTSWMPVYGPGGVVLGWTLDLMRRRDGGFRSTMEFLIAQSCLYFKQDGALFLSLSGAPLARSDENTDQESAIERFLDTLGAQLEPVYGFRSLHAFKAKFQPRLSPMYMVFRDEADLPRIGIAITKAYLPDSGLKDLLSVVRH